MYQIVVFFLHDFAVFVCLLSNILSSISEGTYDLFPDIFLDSDLSPLCLRLWSNLQAQKLIFGAVKKIEPSFWHLREKGVLTLWVCCWMQVSTHMKKETRIQSIWLFKESRLDVFPVLPCTPWKGALPDVRNNNGIEIYVLRWPPVLLNHYFVTVLVLLNTLRSFLRRQWLLIWS